MASGRPGLSRGVSGRIRMSVQGRLRERPGARPRTSTPRWPWEGVGGHVHLASATFVNTTSLELTPSVKQTLPPAMSVS